MKGAPLYTTLAAVKMALNNGELPPFMPIDEDERVVIDERFVLGKGAFQEHATKGLRCPVRGCGRWLHTLTRHLDTEHRDIGGADRVRAALGIGPAATLISGVTREKLRNGILRRFASGSLKPHPKGVRPAGFNKARTLRVSARAELRRSANAKSVNMRNWRNRCEAQISHKIELLHLEYGRIPTGPEYAARYGTAEFAFIKVAWGTWGSCLVQCGYEFRRYAGGKRGGKGRSPRPPRSPVQIPVEHILETLRAWVEVHDDLPTCQEAMSPIRTPLIPHWLVIRKAFNTTEWRYAMEQAASLLGIRGGRFGLPVRADVKESDHLMLRRPERPVVEMSA